MTDDLDLELDELDDFDSDELEDVEDADPSYLRSMWRGYGFRAGADHAEDAVVAHGMVQTFVNAFARDGHYVVSFDSSVSTAGTDMEAKHVSITPSPIADPNLTPEQAGEILTGLAVHEICHPRYGRQTYQAVSKAFPYNPVADRLSNLLDDIRIERRFVADYPGYAGVFTPTLEYVGAAGVKRNGGKLLRQSISSPVNLAIAATRYPTFTEWTPETAVEANWWINWANKWSAEDAPKRHVEATREALAHIASVKQAQAQKPTSSQQREGAAQGGTKSGQANDATETPKVSTANETERSNDTQADAEATQSDGASAGDANDEAPANTTPESDAQADAMTDDELNAATRNDNEPTGEQLPSCNGAGAVDQAADANGAPRREVYKLKRDAQQIVESARNIESDGHGSMVDVAKNLKGLTHGGPKFGPSELATRYIRNAILRSRTGNTDTTPFQKRGRLDQGGLQRSAFGDTRLFENRKAPSPGKYNVWVMVDASGSMDDQLPYAAQVAHAMATATHGTPTVRMAVWAWSNAFRPSTAYAGVAKVWETGQDANAIFRMSGLTTGGTPDGTVLGWAARAIKKATRQDETPVIIFVSDGYGDSNMNERVAEARRMGVKVFSVSFGNGMRAKDQELRFGRGNFVPWAGSIIATAKPLADLFARITSGR